VNGNSATGKTFFTTVLNTTIYANFVNAYKNIVIIRYDTPKFIDIIKSCKGNLIVIDNADVLLNNEIVEYINKDLENQYLIFTRCCFFNFCVSPDYVATIVMQDKTFKLNYKYNVPGWM